MPFTAEELKAWVGTLGLADDKAKVVLESLGADAVLTKVGETILMRQDYSKNLDALKAKEKQLETDYQAKVADENKFHDSLTGWKTQKEKEIETQLAEGRQEAEQKLTAVRDKLKSVGDRYAMTEGDINEILSVAPVTRTEPKNSPTRDPDTGKFVSREDYTRDVRSMPRVMAIVADLNTEYYRLFGVDAPPINWESVMEDAQKNNKPIRNVFEDKFHLEDKRKEIAKTAHDKEIEDARRAGEQAALSKVYAEHPELTNRSINREVRGSPILDEARKHAKDGAPKTQPISARQSTVEAAVSAFNEGKYRGGVEHAA